MKRGLLASVLVLSSPLWAAPVTNGVVPPVAGISDGGRGAPSSSTVASTERDPFECHRLDAFWILLRGKESYPISGLRFSSRPFGTSASIEAELRSYGSPFLFNPFSFDLGAHLLFRLGPLPRHLQFRFGPGAEGWFRFASDPKIKSPSAFVPGLRVSAEGALAFLRLSVPVTARFYLDGIGLTFGARLAAEAGPFRLFVEAAFTRNQRWSGLGQDDPELGAGFGARF